MRPDYKNAPQIAVALLRDSSLIPANGVFGPYVGEAKEDLDISATY
jgi:hypothetical protein